MTAAPLAMQAQDWLHLLTYYLSMSLLMVGGAISTAPDMHRVLVDEQGWLSTLQFNNAVAIAQAAPGPNVLFIALIGLQIGQNASAGAPLGTVWLTCIVAVACTMLGVLLPTSALMLAASRWLQRYQQHRALRAFKLGLSPVVIGMMFSTAIVLASAHGTLAQAPWLWLVSLVSMLLVWRTRLHLLWLLGAGAALGALGWV
ncbi:MAG: chromate transporter [Comamonas sp.]